MADATNYRGFVIVAAPIELADGGWSHEGYIQEDVIYTIKEESSLATFDTQLARTLWKRYWLTAGY